MIRILLFLAVLSALAFGLSWVADQPGSLSLVWGGQSYETSLLVALGIALALIALSMALWSVIRFVFRIPTLMSFTARMRRRNKGFAALTRGMLAAGAGDAKGALQAARDAQKLMGDEPLALLLGAQAAQLSGDRARAERMFLAMIEHPETRLLGLRGMHVEARRRGDDAAAHEYARRAHELAALPWAGQAMLERHAMGDDWTGALSVVEANLARKTIDRVTANRQRAVLKTAIALNLKGRDPAEALALSREAIKLAPGLVPANALAGTLLARKGDLRRAASLLENAWRAAPHPDLAHAYVDMRPGDSASDRLARARTLARIAPTHAESQLTLARAALEARDFDLARRTMAELIEGTRRPTARMCLMMADIEETQHGPSGRMREWLSRAARAPRDPAWTADGIVSEQWLPASPVTGQIDAFKWDTPIERIASTEAPAPDILWTPDLVEEAPDKIIEGEAVSALPAPADITQAAPGPVPPLEPGPVEAKEIAPTPAPAAPPQPLAPVAPAPVLAPVLAPVPALAAGAPAPSANPVPARAMGINIAKSKASAVARSALSDDFVRAPDDPGPDDAAPDPSSRRGLFG